MDGCEINLPWKQQYSEYDPLVPWHEVDISKEVADFATEIYCPNCMYVVLEASETPQEVPDTPYCSHWGESTTVESDKICSEYTP